MEVLGDTANEIDSRNYKKEQNKKGAKEQKLRKRFNDKDNATKMATKNGDGNWW